MTLACEDANSELVEVVTVANVDAEDRVGNRLLQMLKNLKLGLVNILSSKCSRDADIRSIF